MSAARDIDLYLNSAIALGLYSNKSRLRFYMDWLFEEFDLTNKSVLDIGGGSGLCSYYAACRGAGRVICLEPETEGSSSGMNDEFNQMKKVADNVELRPTTLQDFEPGGEGFDVVLLHNSVNHLDETACINLTKDPRSRAVYRELFAKVHALSNSGAKLLVCDCSRYNFFGLLRIRNPFVPTIEWHKHQAPEVWAELLTAAGFVNPRVRWSSFNRLGGAGRALTGNRLASYFLSSHFCLTAEKS